MRKSKAHNQHCPVNCCEQQPTEHPPNPLTAGLHQHRHPMAAGAAQFGPSWQVLLHTTSNTALLGLVTMMPCQQAVKLPARMLQDRVHGLNKCRRKTHHTHKGTNNAEVNAQTMGEQHKANTETAWQRAPACRDCAAPCPTRQLSLQDPVTPAPTNRQPHQSLDCGRHCTEGLIARTSKLTTASGRKCRRRGE
jgi:hypothetical protein